MKLKKGDISSVVRNSQKPGFFRDISPPNPNFVRNPVSDALPTSQKPNWRIN
ncbi:hypothetical protein [Microcoleus sp. bin38.metabat.b11b12b14.051]|uniref:hypothetical protein n=1 Tax=Microcoleus sp. bin38.metabat.b11b12b14.051 TaxID=2742709 RepID=UPI0025ED60DB|nr:hypothetical protein [Microcoleus sp. bin38.metabat.b11b12b14.051]